MAILPNITIMLIRLALRPIQMAPGPIINGTKSTQYIIAQLLKSVEVSPVAQPEHTHSAELGDNKTSEMWNLYSNLQYRGYPR